MGLFIKSLNFSVFFLALAMCLNALGFGFFSKALFTPFGALFVFLAFLNEAHMISL